MSICSRIWSKAVSYFLLQDNSNDSRVPSEEEMLERAQEEVARARNLFDSIDDPEMMDWAILNLRAAEERYDMLIKKAKKNHL